MKKTKILTGLIIMLSSVMLLAGCGSSGSNAPAPSQSSSSSSSAPAQTAQKKNVGVLICDFSDQFQVYMMNGMKDAAKKYPDINFIYQDAKYDANTQTSEMENLIAQKVDAVILMPVDSKASIPMVQEAVKAKIPVITVNRTLDDQSLAVCYVGSDSIQSGEIEMTQMAKVLNGKGNIAILEGQMGQEPQIHREQGIKNVLAKNPDIHIVADQAADWARDKGMSVTENWLQNKNMKIDAIVAHNDEMAIGAEKAIADAGLTGKIIVSGIDATPEALKQLKSGAQAFTVFQDAFGQGRGSIDTIAKVVSGQTVDKQVIIPYELVTPDKADEYAARYK